MVTVMGNYQLKKNKTPPILSLIVKYMFLIYLKEITRKALEII